MNGENRLKLNLINLKGFKSMHTEGQALRFGDITVLLGANGSGKSNLVSFFRMLNHMMTGALQRYIGENGSAETLLYYGRKKTVRITAEMEFGNPDAKAAYRFGLSHAAGDTLVFNEESISCRKQNRQNPPFTLVALEAGLKESGLPAMVNNHGQYPDQLQNIAQVVLEFLRDCRVFQFHDTSKESGIRNKGYINDNESLRGDGGNLAAFLHCMKRTSEGVKYYHRIIRHIRQVMPQFGDFELTPSALNENYIMLNWKEKGSDYLFGPHQISDGSLRFMAIAALLLQPPKTLPAVVILDEPELGLHPSAISILAGMTKIAGGDCQILMASQSPRLVDEFQPDDILIVERNVDNRCSEFKTLDGEKLADWLERYSMSELWEKNVLGGQP